MAFVRVEQRNGRLAAAVKLDMVNGREGEVAKGTVTVISNTRRGSGDDKTDEATAIQWTLWGRQADNAAEYLTKGSRVNIVGRLQNNNYTDGEGRDVYGLNFTCEELDYLDSKAESQARRDRQEDAGGDAPDASPSKKPSSRARRSANSARGGAAAH